MTPATGNGPEQANAGELEISFHLDPDKLRAASAQGSVIFAIAQVLRIALQFGSQIALARLLFPADFGLVAMAYPVVNFASIFSVGFGEAVIQRSRIFQNQVSALFWISVASSLLVTIVLIATSFLVGRIYQEPRLTLVIIIVSLFVPIGALGGVQAALLTRAMRFKRIAFNELLATIIGTFATVLAAWLWQSYWSLVIGSSVLTITGTLLNWFSSEWRPSKPRRIINSWEDIKFGTNVTGYNLATFLTTSADNLIIGAVNGKIALGIYDRSYRLVAQPISQVLAPIGRLRYPSCRGWSKSLMNIAELFWPPFGW